MTIKPLSKNDQLIALLRKPNGTRVSVIVEKFGWQAHTVRAAISGLRKKGFEVSRGQAKKTGEAVYSIVPKSDETVSDASVEVSG